jgi:hypothetical protein
MSDQDTLQCIRNFRHSQVKGMKSILKLMRQFDLASLDESIDIRETNGYIKATVVGQFNKSRHPLLGPQLLVLVNG